MQSEEMINNTIGKMETYLSSHERVCVSVSGGSDSDCVTHMISTNFRQYLHKVRFLFLNTGLEYDATKRHLDYLENRYDISIDRVRGMSVVTAVRKYGVPVLSKEKADNIMSFCNGAKMATEKVMGTSRFDGFNFKPKEREMAIAIKQRGIKVSKSCCQKSKKDPANAYMLENGIDLSITGERRAEGGVRAIAHKSCFEEAGRHPWDKFMPMWFWDNSTKQLYKEANGIVYSDCYEIWGFKRTGCVGCPFNSNLGNELPIIREHEPKIYNACVSVFGDAYRIMDEFHIRKNPILLDSYDLVLPNGTDNKQMETKKEVK